MAADAHAPGAPAHGHTNYVKIWGILLALLVVSVVGPLLEIRVLTLITAFGIAVVKAYIVVKYFMHIAIEKKYVAYLVGSMIVLMVLMVGAVAPDVMHHEGANWHNQAAADEVKRGMAAGDTHGKHAPSEHPGDKHDLHDGKGAGEPGIKPEHAPAGDAPHAPAEPAAPAAPAGEAPAPAPAPEHK
jgi:caa(3)-type oxidase subunit IV